MSVKKRLMKKIAERSLSDRSRFDMAINVMDDLINGESGQKKNTLVFLKGVIVKDFAEQIIADNERDSNDQIVYFTSETTGQRVSYADLLGKILTYLYRFASYLSQKNESSAQNDLDSIKVFVDMFPQESFRKNKVAVIGAIDTMKTFTTRYFILK